MKVKQSIPEKLSLHVSNGNYAKIIRRLDSMNSKFSSFHLGSCGVWYGYAVLLDADIRAGIVMG